MQIIFERSGGIMGLKSSLTLDLNELPLDQAGTLRRLLDEANFFSLTENPPTRPTPDGFQYTLTVVTDTISHTVRTSDTTAPDELHPLLHELSQRARTQGRLKA
ncbi:MAG: hypothetical protein HZB18_16930 [Chloroflexi bacterium]|nr:hypothetical protein [Chloroflexota bacterium]